MIVKDSVQSIHQERISFYCEVAVSGYIINTSCLTEIISCLQVIPIAR